ncbi:hypothetical protein [Pseudanabaena sp. FACHB-2040]|uniref:phasin family protein n=1 Tax=Pseudanabaena sp. FACHB-2040 TaxID=2692859 RepID=UPI0016872AD9|nr:hypothetical protein [Pseudanabaena sp. FACHB-2040]MBD0268249.1 hypothetical protein [Cyanobacteria bacterium Co-bin8]MBD0269756.1 hypothetical protein [Cyanobacteria bacterium Co-bin8]MBD2260076.1 hypothetical protein [Pseudanabaena sp. FACHB-2040]
MAGFGDLVQKAFYLGVGVASYAGEKVGVTLKDVRVQAQKLVDELVARGEITAEEAQRLVNEMVSRAQQDEGVATSGTASEPRRIEILDDADGGDLSPEEQQAEELRRQVANLRQELEQLRRES